MFVCGRGLKISGHGQKFSRDNTCTGFSILELGNSVNINMIPMLMFKIIKEREYNTWEIQILYYKFEAHSCAERLAWYKRSEIITNIRVFLDDGTIHCR